MELSLFLFEQGGGIGLYYYDLSHLSLFQTHFLETTSDLLQYVHTSQLSKDLGGTLTYDHEHWVETQRVSEPSV